MYFTLRAGPEPAPLIVRLNAEAMRFDIVAEKAAPAPVGLDRIAPLVAAAGPDGITYAALAGALRVPERAVRDSLNRGGAAVGLERIGGGKAGPVRWRSRT